MPVSFADLLLAFKFVSSSGGGQHETFQCRPTDKIHWRSDSLDLDEIEHELPEDVGKNCGTETMVRFGDGEQ